MSEQLVCELMDKLQPMNTDQAEKFWPEIDKLRDSGDLSKDEYKEVCDYYWTPRINQRRRNTVTARNASKLVGRQLLAPDRGCCHGSKRFDVRVNRMGVIAREV